MSKESREEENKWRSQLAVEGEQKFIGFNLPSALSCLTLPEVTGPVSSPLQSNLIWSGWLWGSICARS